MKTVAKILSDSKNCVRIWTHIFPGWKKGRSFIVVRRSRPIFALRRFDIWGDEGVWEKVVDFTVNKKGGVPIDDVINFSEGCLMAR